MILFEALIPKVSCGFSPTCHWLAWACAPFSFWHEQGLLFWCIYTWKPLLLFPFSLLSPLTKIKRDYFYEVLKPKSTDPFWSINSNYFCSKWLTFIFACEGTISFYFIHYFVFNWIMTHNNDSSESNVIVLRVPLGVGHNCKHLICR